MILETSLRTDPGEHWGLWLFPTPPHLFADNSAGDDESPACIAGAINYILLQSLHLQLNLLSGFFCKLYIFIFLPIFSPGDKSCHLFHLQGGHLPDNGGGLYRLMSLAVSECRDQNLSDLLWEPFHSATISGCLCTAAKHRLDEFSVHTKSSQLRITVFLIDELYLMMICFSFWIW